MYGLLVRWISWRVALNAVFRHGTMGTATAQRRVRMQLSACDYLRKVTPLRRQSKQKQTCYMPAARGTAGDLEVQDPQVGHLEKPIISKNEPGTTSPLHFLCARAESNVSGCR